MILTRSFLSLAVAASISSCATIEKQPEIAVGQVWTIKDAPNETVRLSIVRIEPYGVLTAVHVSVDGLTPMSIAEMQKNHLAVIACFWEDRVRGDEIGHIPFDKPSLVASLDELQGESAEPSTYFERGYSEWQAKEDNVIYTISVSEAIEHIRCSPQSYVGEEK